MNEKNFNKDLDSLDDILKDLSVYIKQNQKESIPDKAKFLHDLNLKLNQNKERIVQDKKKYHQPITTFWEQFFSGKNNYSFILSSAAIFLIFVGFVFHRFNTIDEDQRNIQDEIRGFGSGNIQNQDKDIPSPPSVEPLSKEEKELLEQYLNEEDPDKKQKILMKIIEFYKTMNQEEKLKKLMEELD